MSAGSGSRMGGLAAVAGACLLLATLTVPQASAQETAVTYPEVKGTTTIHGEGVVGITLALPKSTRIFASDLEIEVSEGTRYVLAAFRSHLEPWALCDFCFHNFVEYRPETSTPPWYASCYDDDGRDIGCEYDKELLELYIVTDGAVTLTVRFRDFTGSTELTASGGVDGVLEELPVTGCDQLPDGSCGVTYGGRSRVIGLDGRPAFASVVGYLKARPGPGGVTANPGLHGLEVCAYPGIFGGPSAPGDPDDHPRGCDEEADPNPALGGEGVGKGDAWAKAHGQQYLGFSVWKRRAFDQPFFMVWGLWLEAGMSCPSRDYFDCTGPPPGGMVP